MDLKQTMDNQISKQPVKLAICGALGRMGVRISALAAENPEKFLIVASIDRPPADLARQCCAHASSYRFNPVGGRRCAHRFFRARRHTCYDRLMRTIQDRHGHWYHRLDNSGSCSY